MSGSRCNYLRGLYFAGPNLTLAPRTPGLITLISTEISVKIIKWVKLTPNKAGGIKAHKVNGFPVFL